MYSILKSRKRKMPVIGIVFLFASKSFYCQAQLTNTVFEDFTQTAINPYLINPAAADTSYNFKVGINAIDELGLVKYVNRFYLDADKRIRSGRSNSYHFVGLQTLNSKIGQYISRSRMQLRYAWYMQLSPKAALSAGISLGFINYAFLTTQGGTGGSDFGPDGSLGIHYVREKTKIGFAIQQIFSPVLMPVNQTFKLNRLYNIDVSQGFRLAPRVRVNLFGVLQYSGQNNFSYSAGFMSDVSEYVLIGVNNFCLKKTSFNFGIQHIRIFESELSIITTYSVYTAALPSPNSTLELFMTFQL
ncbi:MAG: type IX secretion system membrane protein PorP/SprF [Cytophaga sp.]|uniref:type IX secretion system membrane protein PorP/SprF n=1 Tax=Cytophaga sp. TaxID=29535 RepID=UPI003F7D95C5